MTTLTPPYRLLSLGDGDDVVFMPRSYEMGEAVNPHGILQPGALVPMLRVRMVSRAGGDQADYLDFTSGRLIAELPALLEEFAGTGARIRILADGVSPRTIYTVSVEPA
jgi:hypothetical protein